MGRSIKDKVEAILKDYPETRNSDKALIIKFWKFFDTQHIATNEAGDWVLLEKIMYMTSPETIRRIRQKFQEPTTQYPEGQYPATDVIVKERRSKEKGVKFTINTEYPDRYLPD